MKAVVKGASRNGVHKARTRRKSKPADGSSIGDFGDWQKAARRAYANRFMELLKEHGMDNVIVFPVNECELASMKLSAQVHGDGNVNSYAKKMSLSWASADVESLADQLRIGEVRLAAGDEKGGLS